MVVNIGDTVAVVSEVDTNKGESNIPAKEPVYEPDMEYNPGLTLLNKLLQAEWESTLRTLLRDHLCPQGTIITPDGETVDLGDKPLVSHGDLIRAITNAVAQVRAMAAAEELDPAQKGHVVENIRYVAAEAWIVLTGCFGERSEEEREFRNVLTPMFRLCFGLHKIY